MEEEKQPFNRFFVAILEGPTAKSSLPVVAVNDPTLVRLVLEYLNKRVEPKETQKKGQ